MGTYAKAVVPYVQAGWPSVLPVPPDTKHPPPVGFTGQDGKNPGAEQYVEWISVLPDHSVALRLPDGVIGIDVDHYDKGTVQKRGGDHIEELEAKLGPLPATWVSSARPAPSGIRFYRVPAGRYRTKLSDSIEIIQRHHRYAVVWPSLHPAAGGRYEWYRQDTDGAELSIPKLADLPELPAAWVEHLREGATEAGPAAAPRDAGWSLLRELETSTGPECKDMYDARLRALDAMRTSDTGARHDIATERVMSVVMLGAMGHSGAGAALEEMAAVWSETTAGEDRAGEFERMCLTAAQKAVTEWGPSPDALPDPCLMAAAVTIAAPAPAYDPSEPVPPGEEPLEQEREPWSVRSVIGVEAFDPPYGMDQMLARAVLERMTPAIRYAADVDTWLRRGPEVWEAVGKEYAATIVAQVADLMPKGNAEADKGSEEQQRAERRKRFMSSGPSSAIASKMVALARDPDNAVRIRLSDLDAEPHILWAGGQPWNLWGQDDLLPADLDTGRPHLHSAAVLPELRDTPLWDAYLAAVLPDEALREWTMRVLAVSVTGYSDAVLPILLGPPGVGKTSLVKLIMSVLGTYAHAADPRLLGDGNSHASIVYALKGRRLSFIDEGPRRGRWATERLKQLTGGAELTGNRMRENPVSFVPTHTLVLTANEEPQLTDEGLRRRVRLVPFTGNPGDVRRTRAAIGQIGGETWKREAPGILARLMLEAGQWLRDPDSALTSAAPESVQGIAEAIGAEQDVVRQWVESETEPYPPGVSAALLYEAFVAWCRRNDVRESLTQTAWGRRLTELGFPAMRLSRGSVRGRPRRVVAGGIGPSVTPVTEPVAGDDGFDDGLMTGLEANPSSLFSQVNHRDSVGDDGLDGFSPVTSPPKISTTHSHQPGEPEFFPNPSSPDRTEQGSPRSEAMTGSDPNPSSAPKPARPRLTPEEKAKRTEEARAKRAAAAEEKRLAAIADAQGAPVALPAVVARDGSVRTARLFEAAGVVETAMVRSGGLTVDVEHTGYPIGHRLHALRTIQLGDALEVVVFDGSDPDHRATARALFDRAGELGLDLHAHSATADLNPLAYAGVLDAT